MKTPVHVTGLICYVILCVVCKGAGRSRWRGSFAVCAGPVSDVSAICAPPELADRGEEWQCCALGARAGLSTSRVGKMDAPFMYVFV